MAELRGKVTVEGGAQIVEMLRRLPKEIQSESLKRGIREGAKVIRDEARGLAPEDTGRLKRNIIITRVKINGITDSAGFVMVRKLTRQQIRKFKQRTGKKAVDNPQDAFYWRFLEFGTAKLRATPFLRPGFDRGKQRAADAIVSGMREAINKAILKLRK